MIDKVKKYVKEEHMIQEGDSIVIGVSGGADSICLLLFLCAVKPVFQLNLQVVHINHQLREAAKEEEDYVVSLCRQLMIPCSVKRIDVLSYAQREKMSCEEAARELRYKEFYQWINEKDFDKIAVAHHMNDQAETFLFRVARGTGYAGMQGMKPVQDQIIRPLLCLKKQEITSYLESRGITWMEDESNQDNAFARNLIRNEVIPSLCKVNNMAVEHIYQATEDMRELEAFAGRILEEKYKQYVKENNTGRQLSINGFQEESEFVQKHVIKRMIEREAGKKKDIGKIHVDSVLTLLRKPTGKKVSLPYHLQGERLYDGIQISSDNLDLKDSEQNHLGELLINETIIQKPGKRDCIQIIDYDKIENEVQLRYRREGDFFVFDQEGHRKSLHRFFIDQKVPKDQRNQIPLVADGNHIIWIIGMRVSEYYKITKDTKRQVVFEYVSRRRNNGRDSDS
ncbi:MAG: tRNA lysidine(34) synthetase TilS [Anaerostipes sp.]|jgi:tRNA(Ile)-lysidine synthase